MQSLVKKVLHKGFSERNLEGVFQEVASQDSSLQNHTVASQSIYAHQAPTLALPQVYVDSLDGIT